LDIQRYLKEAVPQITIHKILVPGSFEIPYGVRSILNGNFDAIICLGTIIKGDTAHFKYISSSVIDGLMKLQVLGSVPIINGILNTYTRDQALERLASNSGQAESLALSALRMITTFTTH
jgi:6,7-dimethyl-8-ribityllumazine synthase